MRTQPFPLGLRARNVDRYGFDMSAMTPKGPRPVRLAFGKPIHTPEEARVALISMVKDARSKLAAEGAR
jgi:putative heme iron utilization protein